MGLLDLLKKKQPKYEPKQESKIETGVKTYNREFKVAGVTFTNDDNTPRQEILKAIQEKKKPFDKRLDISLDGYEFEGKPAISVGVNGYCIGNIPKENISFLMDNADRMLGINNLYVGCSDGMYYARVKVSVKSKDQ